ncbi:MAG: toxin HicA [bacterium]
MAKVEEIITRMKRNPNDIRFSELCKVCNYYFGKSRQSSSSHRVYKTPWQGNPRINIQNNKGKAKTYQIKQVILAIERLEVEHGHKK